MRAMIGAIVAAGALTAAPAAHAVVPGEGAKLPRGSVITAPACKSHDTGPPNIPPNPGDRWTREMSFAEVSSWVWEGDIKPPDCEPITVNRVGAHKLHLHTVRVVEEFRMGTWMGVGPESSVETQTIRFTVVDRNVCMRFSSVRDGRGRELTDKELDAIGLSDRQLVSGGAVRLPNASTFAGGGIEMRTKSGSVLRLRNGSQMRVDPHCGSGADPEIGLGMKLRLALGSVWAKIASPDRIRGLEVQTERVVAGPRGTTFSVAYDRKSKRTTVRVFSGRVHVALRSAPRRGVVLHKGQRAVVGARGKVHRSRG